MREGEGRVGNKERGEGVWVEGFRGEGANGEVYVLYINKKGRGPMKRSWILIVNAGVY